MFGSITGAVAAELSITELIKQRSMLTILVAACTTAQTAFEAAGNPVDAELLQDLSNVIERSQAELRNLSGKIAAAVT